MSKWRHYAFHLLFVLFSKRCTEFWWIMMTHFILIQRFAETLKKKVKSVLCLCGSGIKGLSYTYPGSDWLFWTFLGWILCLVFLVLFIFLLGHFGVFIFLFSFRDQLVLSSSCVDSLRLGSFLCLCFSF